MEKQQTPEELFHEYRHIALNTVLKLFPYVKGIAKSNNIEREDIEAYAMEGLWQACLKFDPTKGNRTFKNFAINNIRWQVLSRLKKDCKVMSFAHTGIDPKKVKYISLDDTSKETQDGVLFHELFGDDYNLEGEVIGEILYEFIKGRYPKRTFEILKLRLEGKTLQEIGDVFGITKERTRQLLKKINTDLRGVLIG